MARDMQYRLMINNSRYGYRAIAIEWTPLFHKLFPNHIYWTSYSIREIDLFTCHFNNEQELIRYLAANNLFDEDDLIKMDRSNFFVRIDCKDCGYYKHHPLLYIENLELIVNPYQSLLSLMEEKIKIGDFDFFIFLSSQIKELCMSRKNRDNDNTSQLMAIAEKLKTRAYDAKKEQSRKPEPFLRLDKNGNDIIKEIVSLLVFRQNKNKQEGVSNTGQFLNQYDNSLIHIVVGWIDMRNKMQINMQSQRRALRKATTRVKTGESKTTRQSYEQISLW